MKTNTYIEFKNFIKTNCVDANTRIYFGNAAHLFYTAWYIFKHNLSPEAASEYLKKDVKGTAKKWGNHGIYCYFTVKDDNGNEMFIVKACSYSSTTSTEFNLNTWEPAVRFVLAYYNNKLAQEKK